MMRLLFGRSRKKPAPGNLPDGESIRDTRVGDVVVIQGLALDYDDLYFVVGNVYCYESSGIIW